MEGVIKGITKNIGWGFIGAYLATRSDDEQAEFFKGFFKEMESWDTGWQREMQLTRINKKLDPSEVELMGILAYKGEA